MNAKIISLLEKGFCPARNIFLFETVDEKKEGYTYLFLSFLHWRLCITADVYRQLNALILFLKTVCIEILITLALMNIHCLNSSCKYVSEILKITHLI
jgi:hypothetical protein